MPEPDQIRRLGLEPVLEQEPVLGLARGLRFCDAVAFVDGLVSKEEIQKLSEEFEKIQ